MRRFLFSLIMSAMGLAAAAQAQVEWLETEHNFGAFDEDDGLVTCHFRFVNTGDEPLMVVAVRTSCGCTTSKPPTDVVMPGDTSSVSATYNPVGRPGKFEKHIYVDMNTPSPRHNLKIYGTVIGAANTLKSRYPVTAGPMKLRNTLIPFGEVHKGAIKSEFFEIYNASSDTITPAWENLPPYVRATSVSDAIAPGQQAAYSMMFDSTQKVDYGIVTDTVYISVGDHRQEIGIVANVTEDFSKMSPEALKEAPVASYGNRTLDFKTFAADKPASMTFTITNNGNQPLIIRRAYTGDPGVSIKVGKEKIKKGKSCDITVTVDPGRLPTDVLNAKISIITNDPTNSIISLRAVGFKEN